MIVLSSHCLDHNQLLLGAFVFKPLKLRFQFRNFGSGAIIGLQAPLMLKALHLRAAGATAGTFPAPRIHVLKHSK